MLKEFKEFAMRGSVLDLAIGLIIGGAFGKIVTSFVNDILMPPIGLLLGKINFTDLFITLSGEKFTTLADAQANGAVTWNYGIFISAIVDFLIVAFVIFLLVRQINKMKAQPAPAPAAPTTKECPYCFTTIPIQAKRCPHCTSDLE
ncbi:MAG: large-conductance mechanosensitive channel protein MscL [Anaerolineales bacterium]|nr:large-conductance mechanosensitive channel protein MscL [Anaerolineales bacterium]